MTRTVRWIVLVCAGLVLFGLGLSAGLTLARPCAEEDSAGCTWYGNLQGNGEGRTLTTVADLVVVWP